jgi:5-methylcytosine-specific restriction protein B
MAREFTWIPVFKAVADWLTGYEDRQPELVRILKEVGIDKGLEDRDKNDIAIPLQEIDPFTFFCMFTKFGEEHRKQLFAKLIRVTGLGVSPPTDFDGVPTANAMKVWMFPYKEKRLDWMIPTLWEVFKQSKTELKPDTFKRALDIPGTGFAKLTEALFYVDPFCYFPIDAQTKPWLEEVGIPVPKGTLPTYLSALAEVRKRSDKSFAQLSLDAYEKNQGIASVVAETPSKPVELPISSRNPSPVMKTQPLNQILYGPPGTGKTFATIDRALAILAPEFTGTREQKKAEFDRFVGTEQIKFVTFHQSFSYEDFVEGIRADTNEGTHQLEYEVQDGIFKQLCNAARPRVAQSLKKSIDLKDRRIWKISLGEAGIEEGVYQDCIDQGLALIGFGGDADYSGVQSKEDIARKYRRAIDDKSGSDYPIIALNTFVRQVKVGDLFVVTQGNLRFRAIGEVTSDYFHVLREDDSYSQGRKVNWLQVYDSGLPYGELMENRFSQMTIYELRPGSINLDKLAQLLATKEDEQQSVPRVLIIDEINRGNISRIFGELITLIEDSKRDGNRDALKVTLPYSKDKFSVPANVYLIGTMNTADRSLAGLDIALRRRFKFVEMPPRPDVLGGKTIAGIALRELLDTMNRRIEVLLGRDYLLGHSYFLEINDLDGLEETFRRQVLPLLQEYFFEDWQRIAWVLNDQAKSNDDHKFLTKETANLNDVFGSGVDLPQGNDLWRVNDKAFSNPESYAGILKAG